MRVIHKIAVAGAVMVTLVGVGMGTALADPSPGTIPPLTALAGVNCPPFLEAIFSGDTAVACYAPTGSSPIITKGSSATDTTCRIARPSDSNAGIAALNLDQMDGGYYCIDFAFSDRGPNTTSFQDAFSPQAKDAVAWTHPTVTGETSPQPASLTRAQLQAIYSCTDTNWDQVGGANAPIVPVVPQAGSDTRATWLGLMGVATNPGCWINGTDPFSSTAPVVEENTGGSAGNVDVFNHSGSFDWPLGQTTTTAVSADEIFPYSIGDWIAQRTAVTGTGTGANGATVGGHATSIWRHGVLTLGKTSGEAAVTTNAFAQPVINPSFPAAFLNLLNIVVRNGAANPTGPVTVSWPTTPPNDANLKNIFGPGGTTCSTVTAQSDIVSYGFSLLPAASCGSLTAGD